MKGRPPHQEAQLGHPGTKADAERSSPDPLRTSASPVSCMFPAWPVGETTRRPRDDLPEAFVFRYQWTLNRL